MSATFFTKGGNLRIGLDLARQYCGAMVTARQVCLALRELMGRESPEDFADGAGVNRATVYRIVNLDTEKDYQPKIETISALVESKGLTLSGFFRQIEGLPSPIPDDQESASVSGSGGAPHGRSLPGDSLSADYFVQQQFFESFAVELARAIDRLIDARVTDRPDRQPRAPRRGGSGSTR